MIEKLDFKDKRILYELDLNARQSDNEIAKKVGLSREAVRYRIDKLVKEGYINYFMTVLNSMKLGFEWYRTFFKLQNVTLQKENEIIEWLKKRASWVTKVEGKWDLNTGIFCKNVYEYRDLMNEFLIKYSSHIERHEVAIVTRMWHYHRDYLLNKETKNSKPEIMGFTTSKDFSIEQIDEMDYKILEILLKNARMKTIDIARKLKTTEIIVRYRIKKLKENGVILGFRSFLNIEKLGYLYFKLHIKLQNTTLTDKENFINYIHHHIKTVYTTELVGGSDLETEFQVSSNEEFYNYLEDMRKKFGKIIKDYEFMQYTKEYKFTYLPEIKFK